MQIRLDRLRADKILVASWILWFVCLILLPVTPSFQGNFTSVALLVSSNLALWIGLRTFVVGCSPIDGQSFVDRAYFALKFLIPLSMVAFLARGLDYFVLRGVPLFGSFAEVRQALEMAPPNFASVAFGCLSPAILAAGTFGTLCAVNGKRTFRIWVAIGLFSGYPLLAFLNGGRSTFALVVCLALIAFAIGKARITRRNFIYFAAAALGGFAITMAMFIPRLWETGVDLSERVRIAGFSQLVPLDDRVLIATRDANIWVSAIALYALSLGQYFLHAVFEFFALVNEKSPSDPALIGRYQFIIVDQFAKVLHRSPLGLSQTDLEIYNPRSGLYTTFWGPAFIDFKYLTPLYSWVFGVAVSYFQRRVARGDIYAFPLHCLFLFQVGSAIVANGLLWAAAIYANLMFLVFWGGLTLASAAKEMKRMPLRQSAVKGS